MVGYCNNGTLAVNGAVSVEVNANIFSQRERSGWKPPTFIYNTFLDLVTVFVCDYMSS